MSPIGEFFNRKRLLNRQLDPIKLGRLNISKLAQSQVGPILTLGASAVQDRKKQKRNRSRSAAWTSIDDFPLEPAVSAHRKAHQPRPRDG
jgi:hypothetical protein